MLSSILALTALAASVFATPTPNIHYVTVGGLNADGTPNLNYYPNNLKAAVGDKVIFTFQVKNHTVTQSSFNEPCAKLKDGYGNLVGFDSGFVPVTPQDGFQKQFEITVYDDKPIWGYCRQGTPPATHCQSGMVFGINAPDVGNTFDAFLNLAKKSTSQNTALPPTTTDNWEHETTTTAWPQETTTPTVHTVIVGGVNPAKFFYYPQNITAAVGDEVEFVFMAKNHTVTQASFDTPCRKIEATTYPPVLGFDSGFMPVSPNQTDYFPTFKVRVNDTKPVWAYCRQQTPDFSHCGVGMVFSINADPYSDKSFAAFQNLAVWQNGTGVVQPFGPGVATPTTWAAYPAPSSLNSNNAGSGKTIKSNAAALGDDDDDMESMLKKLTNLVPAAVGLLTVAILLLVAVLAIGVVILRRTPKGSYQEILPSRSISSSYKQVPVTLPSSRMREDGTHDYEEPFVPPTGTRYD